MIYLGKSCCTNLKSSAIKGDIFTQKRGRDVSSTMDGHHPPIWAPKLESSSHTSCASKRHVSEAWGCSKRWNQVTNQVENIYGYLWKSWNTENTWDIRMFYQISSKLTKQKRTSCQRIVAEPPGGPRTWGRKVQCRNNLPSFNLFTITENHRKTRGKWCFHGIWNGIYPLVKVDITMEDHHVSMDKSSRNRLGHGFQFANCNSH